MTVGLQKGIRQERGEDVADGKPPSSSDLEVAHGVIGAWVRRDLHWLLAHSTADVEVRPMMWTGDPFRGTEGTKAFVRGFLAAYEGLTIEVESVRRAEDPVALDVHVRAYVRQSRTQFDSRFTLVFWFRNGELVRYEGHVDEVRLAAVLARRA
jgi:ketosteroid isomerase-like protein